MDTNNRIKTQQWRIPKKELRKSWKWRNYFTSCNGEKWVHGEMSSPRDQWILSQKPASMLTSSYCRCSEMCHILQWVHSRPLALSESLNIEAELLKQSWQAEEKENPGEYQGSAPQFPRIWRSKQSIHWPIPLEAKAKRWHLGVSIRFKFLLTTNNTQRVTVP